MPVALLCNLPGSLSLLQQAHCLLLSEFRELRKAKGLSVFCDAGWSRSQLSSGTLARPAHLPFFGRDPFPFKCVALQQSPRGPPQSTTLVKGVQIGFHLFGENCQTDSMPTGSLQCEGTSYRGHKHLEVHRYIRGSGVIAGYFFSRALFALQFMVASPSISTCRHASMKPVGVSIMAPKLHLW